VGDRKNKNKQRTFYWHPKKNYDGGSILDFEIFKHKVILGIEWTDYPPKVRKSDFTTIEIEAEKIRWENIPDLSDGHGEVGSKD
jgi:hypothetical protein